MHDDPQSMKAASSPDGEPLLDDADFAALMAAEHAAHGKDLDAARKTALWGRIDAALPPAPLAADGVGASRLWAGPLVAAALLVLGAASFRLRSADEDAMLHPDVPAAAVGLPVRLLPYLVSPDGGVAAFAGGELSAAATLIFKVTTRQPAAVALFVKADGGEPVVRLQVDHVAQGAEVLLQRLGQAFGYRADPGDPATRFCALAAADAAALDVETARIAETFGRLGGEACVDAAPPSAPP